MTVPAFLHPFAATGQTDFITLTHGHGSTVVDSDGKEYLDAIASLWCVNVGHARREVIEAVTTQMTALASYNTFGRWTNEPADRLAEMIAERAPMGDARVFFTNSGSEAVDTAFKLVRLTHQLLGDTDRVVVIARDGGYHGTAYGGTSLQGIGPNRDGFGPFVGGVEHVGRHDLEAVASIFAERGRTIAAVVAEPIQGASGVHPPVPGYLEGLRRLCDQHGALLIMDEVITGFGRTGTWFASSAHGIEPDLVTFAKGVTSGYIPAGGVIVGPTVRGALEADPTMVLRTGFTYSGHPTAAAAGVACIEIAEREGLLRRAVELGDRLHAGLAALLADGLVTEVRGHGAIWAVDLPGSPEVGAHEVPGPLGESAAAAVGAAPTGSASEVARAMVDAGVIVRPIGDSTLAMCPPLVMADHEVDRLLDVLAAVLGS